MKATIISLMTLVTLLATPALCLDTANGIACCRSQLQSCQRQKANGCIRAGSAPGICVDKAPTQECQNTCRAKGYSKWYKAAQGQQPSCVCSNEWATNVGNC